MPNKIFRSEFIYISAVINQSDFRSDDAKTVGFSVG